MTELKRAHRARHDGFIVVASLLGLVATSSILVVGYPLDRAPGSEAAERIGTAELVTGESRRRPAASLRWEILRGGEAVFDRDAIFVRGSGSAHIVLSSGGALEIDENTLVVLERRERRDSPEAVQVIRGSLTASATASEVYIRAPGGSARLAAESTAQVIGRSDGGSRVRSLDGSLTLVGSHGERVLDARDSGGFDVNGQTLDVTSPSVILELPARSAVRFLESGPISEVFQWRSPSPDPGVLQVANDISFSFGSTVIAQPLRAGQTSTVGSLAEPDSYWWRVVDTAGRGLSEIRKLTVLRRGSPSPLEPRPDSTVLAPPGRGLLLAWSQLPEATSYDVELANNPELREPVIERRIETPRTFIDEELIPANYYWRVRGVVNGDPWPFSPPIPFRLIHKPILDAPKTSDAEIRDRDASPSP